MVEPWEVVVDEKSDRDNVGLMGTEAAGVAFSQQPFESKRVTCGPRQYPTDNLI